MTELEENEPNRRPISSRNLPVLQRFAAWLTRNGVSPNAISVSSMVFAAVAGACLVLTSFVGQPLRCVAGIGAALFIQFRLLANLFDGMVAVEGGKASTLGEIFNEAPDRVSDTLVLVGAGFAFGADPFWGGMAAVMALMTAYVRALGASVGVGQVFTGPMAKPQRMFLLTLAALWVGIAPESALVWEFSGREFSLMTLLLGGISILSAWTAIRRMVEICKRMKDPTRRVS